MTNYPYKNFYYSYFLLILLIQGCSIIAIAQPIQYESTDISNHRSIQSIRTTRSTISSDKQDENFYPNEHETSGGDTYEDEEDSSDINSSATINGHNMTSHLPGESYDDETGPYRDDDDDDDDETEEISIYGDSRSVDRLGIQRSTIDSNLKTPLNTPTTSRMSFVSPNIWNDLFSKPAILVGIIGGIIIGIISAILLVMFIIYRMRKKDEGSYVLEEAPRKSPSHAYTRVSSREFFA